MSKLMNKREQKKIFVEVVIDGDDVPVSVTRRSVITITR